MSLLRTLRRLHRDQSGLAMVEMALCTPFLLAAGLGGAELANYAMASMKIGQVAAHIADNASRIGDTSTFQNRKIYESDINDVIIGAQLHAGSLGLYDNGRVIISSLQVNEDGEQYIEWQRCRGANHIDSSYGVAGEVLPDGMGPDGEEVLAQVDDAVIFVEVHYTYQPLVSAAFVGTPDIVSIASYTVRDNRDVTQIYQRVPAAPDPQQLCSDYNGNVDIAKDGAIT